jgi:phosphatidate phosphatase APP1
MSNWKEVLLQLASSAEDRFDRVKHKIEQRISNDALSIVAYHGFGTEQKLTITGRVLEDPGVKESTQTDSAWRNLRNMYRRFASDEIPNALVEAQFGEQIVQARSDDEGYFSIDIELDQPLNDHKQWQQVELRLLEPQRVGHAPVSASGQVLVPSSNSQFGVISDIDDTVLQTDATSIIGTFRATFLNNAHTRLPFHGVAALYRALQQGTTPKTINPLFYVSSSPWNIYDMLVDFLRIQGIPLGPLMLRDWGLSADESQTPTSHHGHKTLAIRRIMDTYPHLPFILIGDSGQKDPEIYREIVQSYPQRVLAVYIRNVSHKTKRIDAINALSAEIAQAGSSLILADDTLAAAKHAAAQGWIPSEVLTAIADDAAHDAAE